ncbi:MAG: GTPase HflX, partial [Marinibacterium sp.]|nr:GTPase HflX [Marinibacterium sp.]
ISDLPTELVAAFRATLEEVLAADLILHVRDISHDETEAQAQDVRSIMTSLGVPEDRPTFEVLNKIDQLDPDAVAACQTRAARDDTVFAISAVTGDGLDTLLAAIATALAGTRRSEELYLDYAQGRQRAWLFEQDVVQSETPTETGYTLTVLWTDRQAARFRDL